MFEWIETYGVWLMGGGGLFTGLAALFKCFPAAWTLIVNSISAPYYKGQVKALEALLDRTTTRAERAEAENATLTTKYERLSADFQALRKSTPPPDGSSASCDASSDSTPNPSTGNPP